MLKKKPKLECPDLVEYKESLWHVIRPPKMIEGVSKVGLVSKYNAEETANVLESELILKG